MSANNGFATREDFRAAAKRRFKELPAVPLLGGKPCRIRSLTAAEYSEIDSKNIDFRRGGLNPAGVKASNVRLVIACVCDGDGQQVLDDTDAAWLSGVDSGLIEPLVRDIKDHCGLRSDVEDQLKNFATTADSGSPSSSAAPSPTP